MSDQFKNQQAMTIAQLEQMLREQQRSQANQSQQQARYEQIQEQLNHSQYQNQNPQQQFINQMLQKRGKPPAPNQNYTNQPLIPPHLGPINTSQNNIAQFTQQTPKQTNRQSQNINNQLSVQQQSSNFGQSQSNFKVVIRVRPPLPREKPQGTFMSVAEVSPDHRSVAIMEYLGQEIEEKERARDIEQNPHLCVWQSYSFDYVYDQNSTQEFVYTNTAKSAVQSVLEGYNATILAYGQTGTGKTHTMEGFKYNGGDPQRGIVPRCMEEIFQFIQMQANNKVTFMVRASYLQIYNEVISDLLKVERTSLQIREDKKKGVFVEGLSEWAVRSPSEIYSLMQRGALSRATATTRMNDLSSRSHAVFIIIVEQMTSIQGGEPEPSRYIKVGKLNLVDLAGSERVRVTGATGKRLEESKKINQSLSCLGNVIAALTDQKPRSHIPYRDSKLTRILEDSLGGNCKTTMMAMISPSADAFAESQSTLKFATRAKKIKNEARINEDVDQRALLRKYEIELKKLKQELQQKENMMNPNVQQLEAERRRAEEDKNAAITALELRSQEFLHAQEQKRILEEKIKAMNSQMLIGGRKIEDTPQFRTALEHQQRLIRQEYENKLTEIEREREQIEEDKQQVDRYKHILMEYRDIMIALTSRLNERDEQIIQLQEELDAYDRIHRESEQIIELKQLRCQQLEKYINDDCKKPIPQNPYETEDIRLMNEMGSFDHQRLYEPHESYGEDQSSQNRQKSPQLLTADQKIQELEHLLESRDLEREEMKVQLESLQTYKAKGAQPLEPTHIKQMSKDMNRLVLSSLSDLNSVQSEIAPNYHSGKLLQVQSKMTEISRILSNMTNSQSIIGGQPPTGPSQPAILTNSLLQQSISPNQSQRVVNQVSLNGGVPASVSEMLRKRQEQRNTFT